MTSGWRRRYIHGISEQNIGPDRAVPVASGPAGQRDCGCSWFTGMRLDNLEPCFVLQPCSAHPAVATETIRRLQTIPPSERGVGELCEEIFEGFVHQ